MFGKNPFNEYRATQQQVQEKKAIDAESIDGSTVTDVDASIQEAKFVIPEEIPANERTAFHGAAAAAAKAGKKSFNFGGKSHPVTMKKDTAKAIADDVKEGMYKDMDTEKGEPSPRSDAKVKSDFKKRRKTGEKSDVDMNPKLDKGTKDNSMEQKESRIRTALKSIIEGDRAKHYKGATKPETMDDKLKGKGAKDMVNQPVDKDDTEEKGHQDASKAGKTGPQAKARGGSDATRSGDQKIIPSATPAKGIKKTMEAYASMYKKEADVSIDEGLVGDMLAKRKEHKAMASKIKTQQDYHHKQMNTHHGIADRADKEGRDDTADHHNGKGHDHSVAKDHMANALAAHNKKDYKARDKHISSYQTSAVAKKIH